MKQSHFRRWLNEIWRQNCTEHEEFNQLPYTLEQYWNMYKWWLRREYRFQMRKNDS